MANMNSRRSRLFIATVIGLSVGACANKSNGPCSMGVPLSGSFEKLNSGDSGFKISSGPAVGSAIAFDSTFVWQEGGGATLCVSPVYANLVAARPDLFIVKQSADGAVRIVPKGPDGHPLPLLEPIQPLAPLGR